MFWSCGAIDCIYVLHYVFIFLAHEVFLFGLSMIGGDTLFVYVSCFTLLIDLYL